MQDFPALLMFCVQISKKRLWYAVGSTSFEPRIVISQSILPNKLIFTHERDFWITIRYFASKLLLVLSISFYITY
jgi:hypothetical protein